jgi:hypothetical protein
VKKVLLVTPSNLQSNGVGALFLRDLIGSQAGTIFSIHEEPPFLLSDGAAASGRPLKRLLRAGSTRLRGLHSARLRWYRAFLLDKRITAVIAAYDSTQADCIWVTASSPEMIWIAEQLATSGYDVRVTVWDAPEYLSRNLGLDIGLHSALLDCFSSLLRQARAISVIGHNMQQSYLAEYGIRSEIIRHGIDSDISVVGRKHAAKGPVRIVFAGSLYSKKEWNSFVAALEAANWRAAGRPVVLYFMGRFPASGARKPKQVVILGEKSFDEALAIMSTMSLGYLPYWFDEGHKVAARTSFPGKLSAYVAAGLAVFHHAPPYTEVTAFLERHPFGLSCPSLQSDDIISALTRLVELSRSDESSVARQTAFRDELSREAMAIRFQRFLAGQT